MTRFRSEGRDFPTPTPENIRLLADEDLEKRARSAENLFEDGAARTRNWLNEWEKDPDFRSLIVWVQSGVTDIEKAAFPKLTVGIAVFPETFDKIRAANGSPPLADAPADQDVMEFELEFTGKFISIARLDILTTNAPEGNGAIARFLTKFGEGIQQIEIDVTDVDRATQILRERFRLDPIYPVTRPGANGARVNFFLLADARGGKVLVELVEQPKLAS